jgi:hypothetical protein
VAASAGVPLPLAGCATLLGAPALVLFLFLALFLRVLF